MAVVFIGVSMAVIKHQDLTQLLGGVLNCNVVATVALTMLMKG